MKSVLNIDYGKRVEDTQDTQDTQDTMYALDTRDNEDNQDKARFSGNTFIVNSLAGLQPTG